MDLNFTPEEAAFRQHIRQWVASHLPADISHKVHHALRLSRDDLQRWARILGGQTDDDDAHLDGIVITHAHEDHFGALAEMWPRLKKNVLWPARRAWCRSAR